LLTWSWFGIATYSYGRPQSFVLIPGTLVCYEWQQNKNYTQIWNTYVLSMSQYLCSVGRHYTRTLKEFFTICESSVFFLMAKYHPHLFYLTERNDGYDMFQTKFPVKESPRIQTQSHTCLLISYKLVLNKKNMWNWETQQVITYKLWHEIF
jgi:hypothetical protein